jgi:tRNA-specific 2-thiouridylase
MKKIVVGLSGGVDSSVAAALLHNQGYDVIGLTLWLMKGKGQCCSEGMVDAAAICEQLDIPYHIVDSREIFEKYVIDYLVNSYQLGITPSPCSQCNKSVKFAPMLDYAKTEHDADLIATGHYARIFYDKNLQRYQLLRATDRNKDQSYFLYDLNQEILSNVIFPLGNQSKEKTRQIAKQYNLSNASKPDSQDLCLIETHGSMSSFLNKYITPREGDIVDLAGKVIGKHEGIHHYTIGQRKGLGIAATEPLYVVSLDQALNKVVVGNRSQAGQSSCCVSQLNWLSINEPTNPITTTVQVRYRSQPVEVDIVPIEPGRVKLHFMEPQFGITPGQAAVFYHGDIVLGGGIIEKNDYLFTEQSQV